MMCEFIMDFMSILTFIYALVMAIKIVMEKI